MSESNEIRGYIHLVETLITQERVLSLGISSYELSTLMKEYRASEPTYNEIGDNAMVAFYTEEEREDFKRFLKKKGVQYNEIKDSYDDNR